MTHQRRSHDPPREIKKLDEDVVNRIAAGEIILRPANAVKELLENSLDAGSTHVTVIAKEGGLKYLQVQDNGCGIRNEDLPILCERHTTSKLRSFHDLDNLSTLGFRGEALASISYISHVTITTMTNATPQSVHGWKAIYHDGIMSPDHPKPCASTPGTTILAEDLFYNVPLRKKSLKSPNEEYSYILDIVGQYAVYHAGASFTVKKSGEAKSDLHTQIGCSRQEAIRCVYGSSVGKNIVPIELKRGSKYICTLDSTLAIGTDNKHHDDDIDMDQDQQKEKKGTLLNQKEREKEEEQEKEQQEEETKHASSTGLQCQIKGFVSTSTYSGRKTQLILFINGRSVESPPLKKCIEAVYATLFAKKPHPFVFLDVEMPYSDVDVNIHPSKKEIAFLYKEEFIDAVREALETALMASHAQQAYPKQAVLVSAGGESNALQIAPSDFLPPEQQNSLGKGMKDLSSIQQQQQPYRPDKLVRTDTKVQTLHAFLNTSEPSLPSSSSLLLSSGEKKKEINDNDDNDGSAKASMDIDPGDGDDGKTNELIASLTTLPPRRRRMNATIPVDDEFLPTAMDISALANATTTTTTTPLAAHTATDNDDNDNNNNNNNMKETPVAHKKTSSLSRAPVRHRSNTTVDASKQLESIQHLILQTERSTHSGLAALFKDPLFVGMADSHRALVQSGTRLYLIDLTLQTRDLFYQQVLHRFGRAAKIALSPPVCIRELALIALESEKIAGRWSDSEGGGTKEEVAELLVQLLIKKSDLLGECFSIGVDQDGFLVYLPQLIEQYRPNEEKLPMFVLNLGQNVDWQEERLCFEGLAHALADLYKLDGDCDDGDSEGEKGGKEEEEEGGHVMANTNRKGEWEAQHVLMPALRLFLKPQKGRATDGSVVELTRLEQLYRVFERC